ncbi:hypothetical protein Krac_10756 [Ktedonobacter racemifer DSM 44963]|uniref:Response regulator receiver protein n=1 Tax=Ktedonobacter racemifer DSM 44963 TaxID=485913 RepID=D6TIF6_KTERA|nr:hypothetical protein Krac_10756 [Ktedonobacter racemifer DSM 44963]
MSKQRLVIADDHPVVRAGLEGMLVSDTPHRLKPSSF